MPATVEQKRTTTRRRTGIARVDAGDAQIAQSAVGLVCTGQANIGQAMVGAVLASGDVSLSRGGGRTFLAGRDLHLRQGAGAFMVAGGDAEIREGGVGTMVALGSVRIEQGLSLMAVAKHVDAREGSTIGVALAPRIVIAPGTRVLAGLREVAVGGAVAGLVIGIVLALARRLTGR
ncbi:MAG: hypothetical protein ACXWWU_03820 [Candidatus Limnocylindria bacterium]